MPSRQRNAAKVFAEDSCCYGFLPQRKDVLRAGESVLNDVLFTIRSVAEERTCCRVQRRRRRHAVCRRRTVQVRRKRARRRPTAPSALCRLLFFPAVACSRGAECARSAADRRARRTGAAAGPGWFLFTVSAQIAGQRAVRPTSKQYSMLFAVEWRKARAGSKRQREDKPSGTLKGVQSAGRGASGAYAYAHVIQPVRR